MEGKKGERRVKQWLTAKSLNTKKKEKRGTLYRIKRKKKKGNKREVPPRREVNGNIWEKNLQVGEKGERT